MNTRQDRWKCTRCGEVRGGGIYTVFWRWNGRIMEHKCPGDIPRAGHFPAEVIEKEKK